MAVVNTPSYYKTEKITAVKIFIIQYPGETKFAGTTLAPKYL
jgi:hypothetical protein